MNDLCICVFGDLLYDCFIWADRLPRIGETVTGYASDFFAGGKGGNQAVVCARLGARTFMLGKVGGDERGAYILDAMCRNGVDVKGVVVDSTVPTGTDCVHVASDGSNAIIVAPLANERVTAQEVEGMRAWFERSKASLFQLQINADAVAAAMRLARSCGNIIVLNPAPARDIPEEMFRLADYITPNETETEFYTGIYREAMDLAQWRTLAAQKLHQRGAKRVIITMGGHGAYYSGPEGSFMMPAFSVDAVDSTAAGDAFNGGLTLRLAAGDDLWSAMRYASACGAITTSKRGSMPSLPTADEVDTFLQKHQEELL